MKYTYACGRVSVQREAKAKTGIPMPDSRVRLKGPLCRRHKVEHGVYIRMRSCVRTAGSKGKEAFQCLIVGRSTIPVPVPVGILIFLPCVLCDALSYQLELLIRDKLAYLPRKVYDDHRGCLE
jgi:hypothetical protein